MDQPNTDVIQGTLDMLILKTLSLEPMHGFGIARRIEQISRGVFKVNPGSLLTALQRLERAGWLDAEWRQTENSRRAKFYALTRAGRKQLDAETADWTRRAARRRPPAEGGGLAHVALAPAHPRPPRARPPLRRPTGTSPTRWSTTSTRPPPTSWPRGLSPEEARRAARLELGGTLAAREEVREHGWENVVGGAAADLALRRPAAAEGPGVHRRRGPDAGARHRRHHRDLQRGQSRSCSSRCRIRTPSAS